MNRFDNYITNYLHENKEVSLDKIGTIKVTGTLPAQNTDPSPAIFTYDKKIATSEGLINSIAEKEKKNKSLIASDIESHLSQVREFINIGKQYEIPEVGFIKATKNNTYEFLPYSEANKSIRIAAQPATRQQKNSNRSFVQVITLLIVLAILGGLGYEAYQFFIKKQTATTSLNTNTDTTASKPAPVQDTTKIDTNKIQLQRKTYDSTDTVNVRYIFETTTSSLRAKTRTQQLLGYGNNNAAYDSSIDHDTTYYSLYLLQPTRIADTTKVKDSISRYFQKSITIQIAPK